jgi:hypothetical protein
MLQTIEVEIDARGHIHPVEPLPKLPAGRALLTLLDNPIPLVSPVNTKKADFRGLFGLLKAEHGVSLEEMDAAIKQHMKTKFHDCD